MDTMEKREIGKISGGNLELSVYTKEGDQNAYVGVSYNGEKLGELKDVIRGFDDVDQFLIEFEKWVKEKGNVNKDEICKAFSSTYKGNWKNANKGY